MSLEQQIERLNQNLETLVGAIAASNGIVAKMLAAGGAVHTNVVNDNNAAEGKTEAADTGSDEKPGRGRPKTRYFKHKDGGQAVKTSGVGPGSDWVETTKAEYDAMNLSSAKAAQEAQKPAAPADEDPFADDAPTAATTPAKTYTLDDVREIGLKLRDTTSADDAKALIATYGVAKLAELPAAKWADFVDKANAKIKEAEEGL